MSVSDTRRKTWDTEATDTLMELWYQVSSIVLIAHYLGRTPSSVQTQASRRGLPRRNEENERHRRKWTAEDIKLLNNILDKYTTANGEILICEIADEMKRSIDAVSAKIIDILGSEEFFFSNIKVTAEIASGIKKINKEKIDRRKVPQRRECMTCKKPFHSPHAGVRMCDPCRRGEDGSDGHIY